MTWLPAIVLFGSSVFPIGYYLSSEDRDQVGTTGAVSVIVPLVGLVVGIVLLLSSIGALLGNPIRLLVTLVGVVEVFVVVGFLVPRVIGASVGEYIVESIF